MFHLANYEPSIFALPSLLVGTIVAALGIGVLVRERGSGASPAFLLVTASVAIWQLSFIAIYSATREDVAVSWMRVEHVAVSFISVAIFLFTLQITNRLRRSRVLALAALAGAVAFSLMFTLSDWLLAGAYRYFWGFYPRAGWLYPVFLVFFFTVMCLSFRTFFVAARSSSSERQRIRVRAMTVAFGVAYVASLDYLAGFGVPLYPFGYVFILAFVVIAARLVRRHRLVDITPAFAAARIMETMTEGVLVLDGEGVIRLANGAATELLGRPRTELVGRFASEVLEDPAIQEAVKHATDGQEVPEHQVLFARGGDIRSLTISTSVMRNRREELIALVCVIRDVTERERAAAALRDSEARYRNLVEGAPDVIFSVSLEDGTLLSLNPAFERITGWSCDEWVGKQFLSLVHPDDRAAALEAVDREARGETPEPYELRILHESGGCLTGEFTSFPQQAAEKRVLSGVARDVTERKRAQALLAAEKRVLEAVARGATLEHVLQILTETIHDHASGMPCSVLLLDADGAHLRRGAASGLPGEYNAAVDGILIGPSAGSCGTAAYRRQPVIVTDIETDPLWDEPRPLALRHGLKACWSTPILSSKAELLGTFAMYYGEPRAPTEQELELVERASHIAGIAIERSLAEETIRELAFQDPLTGLPNRRVFRDRLTMALAQARRNNGRLAVMFLDLDHFKVVNDVAGHSEGDRLLQAISGRLSELVREGDTVARMGGDEFTLLLPGIGAEVDAVDAAERVLTGLTQSWNVGEQEFFVTASLGIAVYPNDGEDPESLLKRADTAMYRAKEMGRNRWQLYAPGMTPGISVRLRQEGDLRRALERQEFRLHFQPQVAVDSLEVVGVEALLRWQQPGHGLTAPGEFIALAEESGLIVPLGEWVLRTACEQAKELVTGRPTFTIAVNLSPIQVRCPDLSKMVASVLDEVGIAPQNLQLEITESAALEANALDVLTSLKNSGVRIAIDDFGTGYSSLIYLADGRAHAVKIDRSLIRGLDADPNRVSIVTGIVRMAHELNLTVIAEGVETDDELGVLRRIGCDYFQGFLFCRPIPLRALKEFLSSPRRRVLSV